MAQSLKSALVLLLMALLPGTPALAFRDPTRPPPQFMPAAEGHGATTGPRVEVAPMAVLTLQSVIMAPGRQRAIINGETVAVGERIEGARLQSLSETQAVLQGPQGTIVLELTPGIRKTLPSQRATPAAARPQSGETQQ